VNSSSYEEDIDNRSINYLAYCRRGYIPVGITRFIL
jgi:hypothetical protein